MFSRLNQKIWIFLFFCLLFEEDGHTAQPNAEEHDSYPQNHIRGRSGYFVEREQDIEEQGQGDAQPSPWDKIRGCFVLEDNVGKECWEDYRESQNQPKFIAGIHALKDHLKYRIDGQEPKIELKDIEENPKWRKRSKNQKKDEKN